VFQDQDVVNGAYDRASSQRWRVIKWEVQNLELRGCPLKIPQDPTYRRPPDLRPNDFNNNVFGPDASQAAQESLEVSSNAGSGRQQTGAVDRDRRHGVFGLAWSNLFETDVCNIVRF
jgi:hypothetical protein